MEQKNNLRQLYILQYLYERTDENHPATNMDITEFLSSKGISVHRQTIPADIEVLCSFGFDRMTSPIRRLHSSAMTYILF